MFGTAITELNAGTLGGASLLAMVQAVDPAYMKAPGGCKFFMNSTQAWGLRGVSDANGRPLLSWNNALIADSVSAPGQLLEYQVNSGNSPVAQILGFDVIIDNSISALTANNISGPIFGNMQSAMVLRQVGVRLFLRLTERYADCA